MIKLTDEAQNAEDQITNLILSHAECIGKDRHDRLLFALDKPVGKRDAGEILTRDELVTALLPMLVRPPVSRTQ